VPKRVQASVELNNINMIKFKDINYPRRKEKEIITNLPNEIWKDIDDGYMVIMNMYIDWLLKLL
jgi:hypothetical protein